MNSFYIHNGYIEVVIEDVRGEAIILSLHNQIEMHDILTKRLTYSPSGIGDRLLSCLDIGVK